VADAGQKAGVAVRVAGQVLGGDGKPCARARIYLWTTATKKPGDMPLLGETGPDGRFRVLVTKVDLEHGAKIVAKAPGQGPDWLAVAAHDKGKETVLRLARDDVPITGRVIDLEGRPVVGVAITVGRLEQSELNTWMAKAKQGISGHYERDLAPEALDGPIAATTDKDGRFRLDGFGRDRVVMLRLRGDNIEHCGFWVVTRKEMPDVRKGPYGTYAANFTHHALPSKPIVGTVRDKATGKALPGIAVVSSYYNNHWTKTDAKGEYRIVGAAKHDKYSVSAGGGPYLNSTRMDIPDTPGLEPLRVDFDLERGVAITGRLTDKTTGKPVEGYMTFIPLVDNPNIKNYTELGKLQIIASNQAHAGRDGTFTVTAIPGPGVLCAQADDSDRYLPADAKGFNVGNHILDGYHAVIAVNASESDPKSTHLNFTVEPGRSVKGTVLDPDGRPLAGANAAGFSAVPEFGGRSPEKMATAEFTASALHPTKQRLLLFVHPAKKLGRVFTIPAGTSEPLRIRLEPLGSLAGRVVDAEGKPLAGRKVTVNLSVEAEDFQSLPAEVRFNYPTWQKVIGGEETTDQDGKFRVEGLVPGLKYMLGVHKEAEQFPDFLRKNLTVQSGRVTDLGEVRAKKEASE
jgi:protocatechuate 3,4-dioxygenase beta subunit